MMTDYWWKVADRAGRTVAQAAVTLIGADQMGWLNLDWIGIGKMSAIAGLLSVLTSIVTSGIGRKDDPGFV